MSRNTAKLNILICSQCTDTEILNEFCGKHHEHVWIHVAGICNGELLRALGDRFNIHNLVLEDVADQHLAKYEQHEDHSFYIVKSLAKVDGLLSSVQLSIIQGESYIITFAKNEIPVVSTYLEYQCKNNPKISTERVVYDLLDRIVDEYIMYAREYRDEAERFEDTVLEGVDQQDLSELFAFKQQAQVYKRIVRPMKDIVDQLMRPKNETFSHDMYPYLKDLWDHASNALTTADNILETIINLHTIILTQFQYKLSRTMNIMSAVSVIFLPLMVITGIYGMNFQNMPELSFKYAYYVVLGIMLVISIVMFTVFVKRKIF